MPPRTALSQLSQGLRVEELQRLFASAKPPRNRVLLMTTDAAGRRVRAGVRLKLTDMESERGLSRVEQGTGRTDRETRLSTRLRTELRASWRLYRPAPWWFPGLPPDAPMPIGTAGAHFHVHCVIAAGALAADGEPWSVAAPRFLFPVRPLSTVLRGKCWAALAPAGARGALPLAAGAPGPAYEARC